MFKNYLISSWRNITRNKTFGLLNIVGLSVGIVCASLIFLWVAYSFEYNTQLPNSKNLYQVKNNQAYGNDIYTMSATMGPLAQTMQNEISGIKNTVRLLQINTPFFYNKNPVRLEGVYADSSFFSVFPFTAKQGNTADALLKPNQIAISTKMAKALLGDNKDNAIGKTILLRNKQPFTIAAVYETPSDNMTVTPDYVISIQNYFVENPNDYQTWGNCGLRTYATIESNASVKNINTILKDLVSKKSNGTVNQSVFLYPYTDLFLYNSFANGIEKRNDGLIKYVKMFSMIAFIILLIACINFMNLSTARSGKRSKEVGMKKVIGASRKELITQFFTESMLMSFLAVIIAIITLLISVPLFAKFINEPILFNLWNPLHALSLLVIAVVCGLVAGTYPAFYLSSFNPINALKKNAGKYISSSSLVRKVLVVFQFSISAFLIVAVIVIYSQINHTKNRSLGFEKENVVAINFSGTILRSYDAIKNQLMATGNIADVAIANNDIFNMYSNGGGFRWKGYNDKQEALITMTGVTPNYLQLMQLPVASGRYFYDNATVDSNNIIINTELAELMGSEGKVGGQLYQGDELVGNIVGITKPFVYNDVFTKSGPMFFYATPPEKFDWGNIFIKLKPTETPANTIAEIERTIKNFDKDYVFSYTFLEESYEQLFKGTAFVGKLALLFGLLAILISCLGLFGLSAFMAEQRTKEIGIRKVLGASLFSITNLLNKDYLKLVVIACILAFPLAWWVMNNWLQNYEYRISINWWIFILAASLAFIIALATVSFQAIKAAKANPVKSLKEQ